MVLKFKSVLISVTEACHVGCAHCGFIGSVRDRESDPDELACWVTQACAYGAPVVIFTGGEPFERLECLSKGVAAARSHGIPSAVFTSSYWAKSTQIARETLSQLEGLKHLYLSSDVYHQRRVPYQNVYNVNGLHYLRATRHGLQFGSSSNPRKALGASVSRCHQIIMPNDLSRTDHILL